MKFAILFVSLLVLTYGTSLLMSATYPPNERDDDYDLMLFNRFMEYDCVNDMLDNEDGITEIYPLYVTPILCEVPNISVGDAQLDCSFSKTGTVCNHTCTHGYIHEDGSQTREMRCVTGDPTWKPEFKHCKPFKDCSFSIDSAGAYTCTRKRSSEVTTCSIMCLLPFPKCIKLTCDAHGEWFPELPGCAIPGGPGYMKVSGSSEMKILGSRKMKMSGPRKLKKTHHSYQQI